VANMSYEALSESPSAEVGPEQVYEHVHTGFPGASGGDVSLQSKKNTVLKSHGRPPWCGERLPAMKYTYHDSGMGRMGDLYVTHLLSV
jgi:hypothetical protein